MAVVSQGRSRLQMIWARRAGRLSTYYGFGRKNWLGFVSARLENLEARKLARERRWKMFVSCQMSKLRGVEQSEHLEVRCVPKGVLRRAELAVLWPCQAWLPPSQG